MTFDKQLFAQLLEKALGERNQKEFAFDSGVSSGYISKLINKTIENAPSPVIIQKLATVAKHDVTYFDLMRAAGYMEYSTSNPVSSLELPFMEEELLEWIKDPAHVDYIRFMYKASKNGITKELLKKVKLLVDLDS